ncbi:putative signal peptide-containing protein [Cryptosporidium hominis]
MKISFRWILLSLIVAMDIYCQSLLIGCQIENNVLNYNSSNYLLGASGNIKDCIPNHPYMRSFFQINIIKNSLDLESFGRSLYVSFESSNEIRYLLMVSAGMFAVAERILLTFFILRIIIRLFVTPIIKTLSTVLIIIVILRVMFAIYNLSESYRLYDTTVVLWNSLQSLFFLLDNKIYNYGDYLLQYFGMSTNQTLAF